MNKLAIKEISKYLGNIIENDSKVSGISYNSQEVNPGDIFVCLVGEKTDGHKFAQEAISKGAKLIVAQRKIDTSVPVIYVDDTQIALAKLAHYFYGEPSKKIKIIGVTGTNGKTTTTHLIQHIFERNNLNTAVIGTLGTRETTESNYYEAKHTTPQSSDLQRQLVHLVDKKVSHLAMEVSSHALSLHRADLCNFKGAVLTNITQDHLDFHLTMEAYANAKKKLFEMVNSSFWEKKYAVINKDDETYEQFAKIPDKSVRLFSYGINHKSDFHASEIIFGESGLQFKLSAPIGNFIVKSKLNGLFNIYNLLASIAVSYAEEINLENILSTVESAKEVPGRFQIIHQGEKPLCIVDYAHTPDGLENILRAARQMLKNSGKLICVFGCGGDRDPTKRPKMGRIAEELSDFVVITSDNPRSEDPNQIISDILSGIKNISSILVEVDRKNAINAAIQKAKENDIVVVAGKGHEDYQILKDKTIHFDDREEVTKLLQARQGGRSSPDRS